MYNVLLLSGGNKDEIASEAERRLANEDADVGEDSPMFAARVLRGSYVRFGHDLDDPDDDSDQQQKRSKVALFFLPTLNEDYIHRTIFTTKW